MGYGKAKVTQQFQIVLDAEWDHTCRVYCTDISAATAVMQSYATPGKGPLYHAYQKSTFAQETMASTVKEKMTTWNKLNK